MELFWKQAENVDQLAPCASSNASEDLNNMFSSLALKRLHFGGSESCDYRLGCGVACKYAGNHFVPQVLTEVGLSPGKHTKAYADAADRIKARECARRSSVAYARTRLNKKLARSSTQASQEIQEGKRGSSIM